MKKLFCTVLAFLTVMSCAPSFAEAGPCTLREGYVIAVNEEIFDKVVKMLTQGDYEAAAKIMESGLAGMTKEGGEVFVDDWGFGATTIRPKGSTSVLWTNTEAVNCQ